MDRRRSESNIVVRRWPRCLDLSQSRAGFDHGLNTIAEDHEHVTILRNLPFIGDASVSENDQRSAVLIVLVKQFCRG
jgi:hypothetical protein